MVSREDQKLVVWPHYFDTTLTRAEGRKLPTKYAVEKPTVETIAKAAQSLGLHPVIEKQRTHPKAARKHEGRVLIDKKTTKTKLLLQIAHRL